MPTLGFEELVLESSRAFPDDEEDDEQVHTRVFFEPSESGKEFLANVSTPASSKSAGIHLYLFSGKIATGFAEGFLKNNEFNNAGSVFVEGFDGIVDSLLSRRKRRPALKVHTVGNIVFGTIDSYGVPRSLSNDIAVSISQLIEAASQVIIFHSEPLAAFLGKNPVENKLFYLKCSTVSILQGVEILPQPNIISGITASVMTECERSGKNGLLFLTYSETELVDSISTSPFFCALDKGNTTEVNMKDDFRQLTYNRNASSKTNLTHIGGSNLYT